ncbi:unnamed protein product [Paramecium octaurelia]|uniref:Uncharacterized protein n=1 Tax=Paramecium octaurelia TaxID=43137 RepID=A0A8S1UHR8_PAROT|nr:unnamed protein product [Paramecium octaurelia]
MQNAITNQNGIQCNYQNICGWKMQTTTFQTLSKKESFVYMKNDRILQVEQRADQLEHYEVIKNLELVKHLTQKGEYVEQSNKRKGKWMFFWKQQRINAGGFYNEDGLKVGRWIELFDNFWEKAKIFLEGGYQGGKKIGRWNIIYLEKIIAGGNYSNDGLKSGKWIELHPNFYDLSEMFFIGEYKSGKRFGLWKIINKKKLIGGGLYNENGLKDGYWIDVYENYFNFCQVIFVGQYQNGRKCGKWETMHQQLGNLSFIGVGGGLYDEFGVKSGLWKELHSNFQDFSLVLYEGGYIDGLKVGNWKTLYRKYGENEFQTIGSGFYDQDGMKIGTWKEVDDNFWEQSQINLTLAKVSYFILVNIIKGKNSKNGRLYIKINQFNRGGGQYNIDGKKHGKWIDIDENYSSSRSILYEGEYKDGSKIGTWFILKNIFEKTPQMIGGGIYDDDGMKNGKWHDLFDNYREICQVIQVGNFMNGKMQGNWNYIYKHFNSLNFHKIGGGQYDNMGKRDGVWLELNENFSENCQIILVGEYKNGYKQGRWNALFRGCHEYTYKTLGGGVYQEDGLKNGKWTEIHDNFSNYWQQINHVEYQNGIKQEQE